MQVVLVMFRSDAERRSFSLPRQITVIGRREDCDLRIPLAEVSRKHCRFIVENDSLRLEDLGSSNGTFHNGVRIQEATIQPGDTVQIGPVTFVIQIDGVPADDQIQPRLQAGAKDDTSLAIMQAGGSPPAEEDDLEILDAESPEDHAGDSVVDLGLGESTDSDDADQPENGPPTGKNA